MRISDWSSDVCSSDLFLPDGCRQRGGKIFARAYQIAGVIAHPDENAPAAVRSYAQPQFIILGETARIEWQAALILRYLLKGSASKGAAHARRRDCGPNGFAHDQIFAMRLGELVAIMAGNPAGLLIRSEENTSELQSLMRISSAVFVL